MDARLAAWAVSDSNSRGRRYAEAAPATRSQFQRDRDRIIHCTAFRRLEYKTQVFINHEGDLFRTRLTHTLEVAQIARSLARALNLNEDLVEAISLAHDLGHTPFGHAGQDALNECMQDFGGFEHNIQSLRTVDLLEEQYLAFRGLNLCYETREGILKHCSHKKARELGELGERFLLGLQPSLEAQICNLADSVAYSNHDVDDGLRAGLLTLEQLGQVDLVARYLHEVRTSYPDAGGKSLVHEITRRMINAQVVDLIEQTRRNISQAGIRELQDVHKATALVAFSAQMQTDQLQLQQFLRDNLYWHYQVLRMMAKGRRIIHDLFDAFSVDVRLLPPMYQTMAHEDKARAVADYVAGMTDRYAAREHHRIFGSSPFGD
jgi:dGTPase